MSFVNRDSDELSAGFTIRDLRTAQKAEQRAIFESNFVCIEKDEQNSRINASDESEDETMKDNTQVSNSDDGCSETSKMDESCKLQKNSDTMNNKDSSSEIEGFLIEQVYEYKCRPFEHGKTLQTDAEMAQNSDSSGTRLPTGYFNISSCSNDSIKNINSSGSNDETIRQTIADEPPTKRGKNFFFSLYEV